MKEVTEREHWLLFLQIILFLLPHYDSYKETQYEKHQKVILTLIDKKSEHFKLH